MRFRITASSRIGCVRQNNEDMILVDEWCIRNGKMSASEDTLAADRFVLAVADGMGGHNSGEVASSDVLHNFQFFFNDLPVGLSIEAFNEAIYGWLTSINNIIESKSLSDERFSKMGTTLVSLAYYGGEFYWMNCGDSRLYRLHDGKLHQISTDHSLNNLLGVTDQANIITNCIGGGCKNSFIDIVDCTADVTPGDVFLLCSDGLTDMLSDAELEQRLANGYDADSLCRDAEQAGGIDNVSCIVAEVS